MTPATATTNMKAMQLTFDKQARLVEISKPTPKKNELLVKVVATALDTATGAFLEKSFVNKFVHSSSPDPLILGWHYAGTVVELGSEATGYNKGDDVWGHLQYEPGQKQGTFAEYILVEPDACALKPEGISFRRAAAAATEGITALQAMRDQGGLENGMHVLINGAGGGVGSIGVSIAKQLGAHVTGVCSTEDVKRVEALGADTVMDYSKGEDPLSGHKYNVIFDTPNALSVYRSLGALQPHGAYVATLPSWGWLFGLVVSLFTSKKVRMIACKSKKVDLELIGEWLQDGLPVAIDSHYKIIKMQEAFARQNNRSKVGRVVIDVEDGWE